MLEPKFVNLPWCRLSDVARFMLLVATCLYSVATCLYIVSYAPSVWNLWFVWQSLSVDCQ